MSKISYADYPGLSVVISAQFAFEMCVADRNRQKSQYNPQTDRRTRLRWLRSAIAVPAVACKKHFYISGLS